MSQNKVVILGAGHVGSHCGYALACAGIAEEIVLVDIVPDKASAQALDIADSVSFMAKETRVRAGDYEDCADASLVVAAIGEPRLPGQTRLDLLARSVTLLRALAGQLEPFSVSCPVITITNPADIAADFLRKRLNLSRWQCFSTGTLLDTARLIRLLSEATGTPRAGVHAFVLGEHGNSSVPAFSAATVDASPLARWRLDEAAIRQKTRDAGMAIIEGKGSTEFGIGRALADLAQCILRDEKRVLPVSPLLQGEYGETGVHAGVPCRIGRGGVEEIVKLNLNAEEKALFHASCDILRKHIALADAADKTGADAR